MCAIPFTPLQGSLTTSLALDRPVSGASHNHDPDPDSVCVTKAILKSLSAQTTFSPSHLFAQTLDDLPDDAKLRLDKKVPSRRWYVELEGKTGGCRPTSTCFTL